MKELNYIGIGHFYPTTKKMIADLNIPKEDSNNQYIFLNKFDISKNVNGSHINAIFCHMVLEYDDGILLSNNDFDHILTIKIDKLKEYPLGKKSPFDFETNYSLLIIHHDNTFKIEDVETVYNNLERLKNLADNSEKGYFSIWIDSLNETEPITPRKLGVSIIRK